MVADLDGPTDFVERWRDRLPAAPVVREVRAQRRGFVSGMDGEKIGLAVVHLGGGRLRGGDKINPSVGLSNVAMIGDAMEKDTPLAIVHAANDDAANRAEDAVRAAFVLADVKPGRP